MAKAAEAILLTQEHRDASSGRVGIGELHLRVRAETDNNSCDDECERKQVAGKAGRLAGDGEDSRSDHDTCTERYRPRQAQASPNVLALLTFGSGMTICDFSRAPPRPLCDPRGGADAVGLSVFPAEILAR